MSVYKKLSLAYGGGIVSPRHQAEQIKDEAHIIIGLGGTGVHCIRTIKTQMYASLKSDDPDSMMSEYSHIRFIGVDSDARSNEEEVSVVKKPIMVLDESEYFLLSHSYIRGVFDLYSEPYPRRELREDLQWLNCEEIDVPESSQYGAQGCRQVGLFLMMERSEEFMNKLEYEINQAKCGLWEPRVNVHVITGMCGGTGSGCFLDVCYMLRSIERRIGGLTIYGYSFLPDISDSLMRQVEYEEQGSIHQHLRRNGYAAMQELDYCMNLQYNGGKFTQPYQDNRKIKWDIRPVDRCFLISGIDKEGKMIPDAYNYAINVTSEYIMNFLTCSDEEFGLAERLANFQAMVAQVNQKKVTGSIVAYSILGGSCATVPFFEMDTYLVSGLFEQFSQIDSNKPSREDVISIAARSLGDIYSASDGQDQMEVLFEKMLNELLKDAELEYMSYSGDWKRVNDYGNAELVEHYVTQTLVKSARVKANAEKLLDKENPLSLINRLKKYLDMELSFSSCGPAYVHCILSASESYSLFDVVDAFDRKNAYRWEQEEYQSERRKKELENAKTVFESRKRRSLMDNDAKRFEDYELSLMSLQKHNYMLEVYKIFKDVLSRFREQISVININYYSKVHKITEKIFETFKNNKTYLEQQLTLNPVEINLVTFNDVKSLLDIQLEQLDSQKLLRKFLTKLVEADVMEYASNDDRVISFVKGFIAESIFLQTTDLTIIDLLKHKLKTDDEEVISNYLYEEYMKPLQEKSKPYFYFEPGFWNADMSYELSDIHIPKENVINKTAQSFAEKYGHQYMVKDSSFLDRIYYSYSLDGLPLAAYGYCKKYEQLATRCSHSGLYIYERKENEQLEFNDWRNLPSVIPQSLTYIDNLPYGTKKIKMIKEARELGYKAFEIGLIDKEGMIHSELEIADLESIKKLFEDCDDFLQSDFIKDDPELTMDCANHFLARLDKECTLSFSKNDKYLRMRFDGYHPTEEDAVSILMDYFVSAPVLQMRVKKIMEKWQEVDDCVQQYKNKINALT